MEIYFCVMELGMRIRELRKLKNYSQQVLADEIGVGTSTVSSYEAGNTESPIETLVKISRIFNVSTDYLLGLSENYRNEQNCDCAGKDAMIQQLLRQIATLEEFNQYLKTSNVKNKKNRQQQK